MPATKTAKSKTRSRRKTKPKSKAERKEINKRNSMLSTGPRTARGQGKSKYNAVTHGMTARTVLLPGEDAAALAARQQHLVDAFQPRNSVELAVIEGMAGAMWKSDRADLAAGRRITERLRHEPVEQAKKEQDEAVELGGRLFWQPSFPLPISKRFPIGKLTEPLCSENAVHPHHPARIKLRLEYTIPGCDWLCGSWNDLLVRLYGDKLWLSADPFKMVRLMGKHAIDMVDDLTVARVFLDSLTLMSAPKGGPERETFDWQNAMIKLLITFDVENKGGIAASAAKQCEPFARRLAELPLAKLAPRNEEEARRRLTGIIEEDINRLRHVRQALQEIADADAAEAPGRLAFELGPEGDRYRRYGLSAERLVIKRFGDFLTTRGKTADGTFDPVDVDLQSLLGIAAPDVVERAGEARSAAAPPHPACGRPLPAGRGEEEDRVFPPTCPTGTADRPGLEMPASSHYEEISCDDEHFLRNEAIAHRGDSRNEASADRFEQETDATTASRFDETEFGDSRRSPGSVERSAPVRDRADGSLEANLDLERRRREFKKHSWFGAKMSEKRSERARREAEEAEAALNARSGLEMPASSPYEEISCDDENVLRNEAIAHRGDPRNEASADGGEHETDATNASRFDETRYRHSGRSMASGERTAPARDGTDGTLEANIEIDRLRMELKMRASFQAQGPGKPSKRARREAAAALHALSGLEMPASSPHQEISYDDENVLRNEAIAHRSDPRNEASADGGGRETDATTESRSDETEFGHSRSSPGNVGRSAPATDRADGSWEANLDIERRRRELEMQTPFRANTPGKPSERDRWEEEEVEAALDALSGPDMPVSSPCEEISCDDKHVLRNEANAHCGDPRNEASADGGGQETDATTASRPPETEFGHSRSSPGNVERNAPARDRAEGSLEGIVKASTDIEQLRRELEVPTPFRASRPGKPSESDLREMNELVAAYNLAVRREAERRRRTSDAEGKENGA